MPYSYQRHKVVLMAQTWLVVSLVIEHGTDKRRIQMVVQRTKKDLTLRGLADRVSNRIGRRVSHVTIHKLESDYDYGAETAQDIKDAILVELGLETFPEGPADAGTAGEAHGSG